MNIIHQNNYPNVIVFTHGDMDGIFSAMAIKYRYDNNLLNDAWDRNVHCYICGYSEMYKDLNWFKERVEESFIPEQENIVFMTDYAIQPNDTMVQFWNWLTDKGCKFYWIDHHITAIQNLKHLNIPGNQNSKNSGCLNTWEFLTNFDPEKKSPMCIRYANDFDIWNKNSEYSWEKQLYPLCYFIESLGSDLNNNSGELVQTCYEMFQDNGFTDKCIGIGKFIWKFVLNKYQNANKKIHSFLWNDYKCLCINSSWPGSTQFEQHEEFSDADLLISWSFNGKTYQYGLYSTKPNIHVGDIAKFYLNGGGHKGAAGGETKEFIFYKLLSN